MLCDMVNGPLWRDGGGVGVTSAVVVECPKVPLPICGTADISPGSC